MPDGQKVGDAYIEVTPELNTSKIDLQMQKLAEKLERKLGGAGNKAGHQFATNFNRQVNAAVKSTGLKFDQMFDRIEVSQGKHLEKMSNAQRLELRKQNQQIAAQYARQLKMRKDHIDRQNRLPMPSAPAPGVGGMTPHIPGGGGGGKGGGRTGRPVVGKVEQAFKDVISILPGQLEGLFKDPKIALAVTAAATAAGAAIAPALIGAAGAGVGLAGVVLAAKFLASADPAFKKATEQIGASINSALLTKLQTIAPVLQGVMQKGKDVITGIIASIDLGPIQRIAAMVGVAFERWGPIVSDIINSLMRIGENVMPTILSGVERLLTTFDKVLFEAEKNKDVINSMVNIVFDLADAALYVFGGFIQLAGAISKAAEFTSNLAGAMNDVLMLKWPSWGSDAKKAGEAVAGTEGNVTSLADKYKLLGSSAQEGFALQGAAAIDAARGILQNATSTKDAAAAQKDLNAAIDAYNDKVVDQNISMAELSNSLLDLTEQMKKNHGTVKAGTRAGNDNIISLGRQLDSYYNIAKGIRDAGGSAAEADAKFNQLTSQLKRNKGMTDAARKAVEEMASRYRSFAGTPNITKTVNVKTSGLESVKAALTALKTPINVAVNVNGKITPRSKIIAGLNKQDPGIVYKASGGMVRGPGGPTADKVPAMLSNKEYVIKASAVKKLGTGFLDQVNAGKVPIKRALGGMVGNESTDGVMAFASGGKVVKKPPKPKQKPNPVIKPAKKPASNVVIKDQVKRLVNLNKQMSVLTKTLEKQNVLDEKYQQKIDAMRDMFNQYVNLSQIDLEGKKTGNVISELITRATESKRFAGNVQALKNKGLSTEGIDQVLQAGPSSPLAKMLMEASSADIQAINKALDDKKMADDLTKGLNPAMEANRELIKSNKALQAAIERQIFVLEDKGVDKKLPNQKHAGGNTLFTPAQLKQIQDSLKGAGAPLKSGGGIRVEVGGKEVDTVIRKVNAKDSRPQKRATNTRKRR